VIEFGSNAEGDPVLSAMRSLPALLQSRRRPAVNDGYVHAEVVIGPWKRLVFGQPRYTSGAVDKNAYVFCVLEQFHRTSGAVTSTPRPPAAGVTRGRSCWRGRRGRG